MMVDGAMSYLKDLPGDQLSRLTPGSSVLQTAVVTGFGQAYGQLSDAQMQALRQSQPGTTTDRAALGTGAVNGGPDGIWMYGRWISAADSRSNGGSSFSSLRFGELGNGSPSGVSQATMSAYTSAYSGMGLDHMAIAGLAAARLDRATFDALSAEGFDQRRIVEGARATRALGLVGGEAASDVVRTDENFVAALAAFNSAKTDDERAAAAANVQDAFDTLSPEEQDQAKRTLERFNAANTDRRLTLGDAAARATDDAVIDADRDAANLEHETAADQAQGAELDTSASMEDVLAMFDDGSGLETPAPVVAPDKADQSADAVASPPPRPQSTVATAPKPSPGPG